MVSHRDEVCVDAAVFHVIILLGTVDPLHVQKIDLHAIGFHEDFPVFLVLEDLLAIFPEPAEIEKIECHFIIPEGRRFNVRKTFHRLVINASLQILDKFIDGLAGGKFVQIQV